MSSKRHVLKPLPKTRFDLPPLKCFSTTNLVVQGEDLGPGRTPSRLHPDLLNLEDDSRMPSSLSRPAAVPQVQVTSIPSDPRGNISLTTYDLEEWDPYEDSESDHHLKTQSSLHPQSLYPCKQRVLTDSIIPIMVPCEYLRKAKKASPMVNVIRTR